MTPRHLPAIGACALLTLCVCAVTAAAATPTVVEFKSPNGGDGTPLNIAAGPGGDMWFTYGSGASSLAKIDPAGTVTDLTALVPATARPDDVATGPDGNAWVTESATGSIARITPGGTVTEYPTGLGADGRLSGITTGPDGNLWFTATGGTGAVGRITTAGQVTVFTAGILSGGKPLDIVTGPDGNLWFTYSGASAVGRITTGGAITNITSGFGSYTPVHITSGSDGNLWVALRTLSTGALARVTPAGAVTLSGTQFLRSPFGIVAGGDGNLWFDDTSGLRVYAAVPSTGSIPFSPAIGASANALGMGRDASGNVWLVGRGSPARIWRVGVMPPVVGEVTATPGGDGATITFPLNGQGQETSYYLRYGTRVLTSVAGGAVSKQSSAAQQVTLTLTGLRAGATYQYRLVAQNGSGTTDPTSGTFTVPASGDGGSTPATPGTGGAPGDPEVRPVLGKALVADPLSGSITVRPPGATRDIPLGALGGQLPMGTTIDATRGKIALTSALGHGRVQTATFWGGRFSVGQAAGTGLTRLIMDRTPLKGCPGPQPYTPPAEPTPVTSLEQSTQLARSRPPRRILWGSDHRGRYRTQGRNSVATVRGTRWATIETCTGTTTVVTSGSVMVRDVHTGRRVLVRAGHSHTVRTPR